MRALRKNSQRIYRWEVSKVNMKKKILAIGLVALLLVGVIGVSTMAEESKELDLISYFELEGVTATLQEESIDFTLTEESGTVRFNKPLASSGFSFRWNGVEDADKKLEAIGITLTDIEDSECSVKVTFGKLNDEYTAVKYNDEKRAYLAGGAMYKMNDSDISVIYNATLNQFDDGIGAYSILAESCMNGSAFSGFPALAVNMEFVMTGQVGATFSLKAINEQPFGSNHTYDNVAPMLCIPTGFTKMLYNSVNILPKAAAYDVLGDETTLSMTVQDPAGDIVKDVEGKELNEVDGNKEYRIKFDKYGSYRITYVASDGENKSRGMGYQIYVKDLESPTVELKKDLPQIVKVGEEIVFPECEVTDNVEGEFSTWVSVEHPEGHITYEKGSFTPSTEGIYTVTFHTQDTANNHGRLDVMIYVEGSDK